MNLAGSIRLNRCGMLVIMVLLILFCYYLLFRGGDSSPNLSYVHKNVESINMRKLLIGSIQVAQLGGLEVIEISKQANFGVHSKGKTKEGANDPVTIADFRSHCVMRLGLKRLFPKLKIFSEEDGGEDNKCPEHKPFDLDPTVLHESVHLPDDELISADDVTVWIDPLDATQEYTEKLFQYVTTMVCVAVKGQPIIGVIHSPFAKATTWSWLDRGTSEDLLNLPAAQKDHGKGLSLIVSRSHAGDVKEFAKTTFGETTNVIAAAGAGYKVLQVVHGNATAYIHTTVIKKWDICAGNAILNNLKGKMTDLDDAELDYGPEAKPLNGRGVLATFQSEHAALIDQIRDSKGLLKHLQ